MLATQNAMPDSPRGTRGIPRLRPCSVALLSYGFRPFFLGAAIWACFAMIGWLGLLAGAFRFASSYGAVTWHAHEFLFGYVSAVMTGFLLTAIPNWTGRMPLQGGPLLALWLLWVAGRISMLMTDVIGDIAASAVDSIYLFVLTAVIVREILAGRNWRNLKVVALIGLIAAANVVFHIEVIGLGAPNYGVRAGIAAIVLLIVLVGGRVTPSFTHNWLARRGDPNRPAPLGRFDFASIAVTAAALILWIAAPDWIGTAGALAAAAVMQAVRLWRWAGLSTWREPIVLILHLGYAFVPLGALTEAVSIAWPQMLPQTGALHAWTTGAMGTMTLAIMTRATRGHTGRDISAGPFTIFIYAAILFSAASRVAAPLAPSFYSELLYMSAAGWIGAFAGFVGCYGPMLVRAQTKAGANQ